MTESQWLKAVDGDAMLAAAGDRLSPRKWTLLACGVLRRLWDTVPDGPFREAVRFSEDRAGEIVTTADGDRWLEWMADAHNVSIAAAEDRQRETVAACDPDADREQYRETAARRINPAVPLFRAASGSALDAVEYAGQAVRQAANAIRLLFIETGPLRLSHVRRVAIDALVSQANAGACAALALAYKARGDAMADLGQVKNPRVRQAEAEETVRRLSEATNNRTGNLYEQKEKADRKALGKLLLEQLGNPFRPFRFAPRWRTEAVVGIARAIDVDRTVERYPIILDALLDAECDEEAILRHVRGTEHHNPDPTHAIGCWVIDLILQKDEPLFALPPLIPSKPTGPGVQLGLFEDPAI